MTESKKPWYVRLFDFLSTDGEVDEHKLGSFADAHERAREAEARLEDVVMQADARIRKVARQRDEALLECGRLKSALELYADRARWRPYGIGRAIRAHDDAGKKAREALGMKE